jgi:His-Xaa-Ser system protein HxsD
MDNNIESGIITVFLDSNLFSKDAIFKCLYWYGDKFHTNISIADDNKYRIEIRPQIAGSLNEEELNFYLLKLERDLIDFNLRDIVTKETSNVRDLLIAKAFSNGEFDEKPHGELSDPVGFDPNKIATN